MCLERVESTLNGFWWYRGFFPTHIQKACTQSMFSTYPCSQYLVRQQWFRPSRVHWQAQKRAKRKKEHCEPKSRSLGILWAPLPTSTLWGKMRERGSGNASPSHLCSACLALLYPLQPLRCSQKANTHGANHLEENKKNNSSFDPYLPPS